MIIAVIFDGVGLGEWLVLLAVILIVVGPKKLPSAAREFGNKYGKFKRAAEEFKRQLLEMDNSVDREIEGAFKVGGDESLPNSRDLEDGAN